MTHSMTERRRPLAPAIAVSMLCMLGVLSSPGRAAAAFDGDTIRLWGTFDLGVGGVLTDDATSFELDLAPSFGGSLGLDIGVGDFFALGAMGTMVTIKSSEDVLSDTTQNAMDMAMDSFMMSGAVEVDAQGSAQAGLTESRSTIMDFAVYPRLRLPLPIIEPYIMVPLGYAALTPPEGGESQSGMSFGVLGGLAMGLLPILSIVVEGGVAMYFLDGTTMRETRINAGIAIGF